jgi:pimeloyl-ACP methyl ester carboxylesterase
VLLVLGSSDAMTPPRAAKALIDACRSSRVVTLPHSGHSLMAENPDGVRTAIADFARSAFAAPAG